MLLKVQGIILKVVNFNESDKILTIFTRERGKIQAISKGSRKPKSQNMASTQVFSLSDLVLYKGKNLYNLNQSEVLNSYYPLRDDLEKLSYASYIIELTNTGLIEEESNTKVFGLLLKTLDLILKEERYEEITRAFELKFISYLGYRPHVLDCVNCNKQIEADSLFKFSILNSGVLCESCRSIDRFARPMSIETLNTMRFLLFNPFEEIFKKDIDKNILKNIGDIMNSFISKYLGKTNFKSLDFINTINKLEK